VTPGSFDSTLARLRALGQPAQALARSGVAKEPRGARLDPPTPASPPTARPVTIRLPNNRQVRGAIAPAAAHRDDVAALRRVMTTNNRRAFAAIQHNARAIDALARSVRELALIVAELQARGGPAQLQGLLDSIEGLDLRLRQQGATTASLSNDLQLQARTARIEKLNTTANMMQTAAFGEQGKLFSRTNLKLAGNNLLWGFMGDAMRGLGVLAPGETSALGWLGPVASLAVSHVTLSQPPEPEPEPEPTPPPPPERFITGIATNFEPISGLVGGDAGLPQFLFQQFRLPLLNHFQDPVAQKEFIARKDVPVTATLLGDPFTNFAPEFPVMAFVNQGVLEIRVFGESEETAVRVSFLVDTAAPPPPPQEKKEPIIG
jgi:hypothetical protein